MSRPWLVVDLEATCDQRGFSRSDMETIEVGCVLVDDATLRPVDEFQTFVRPVVRPHLTDFCRTLTSIRQADVDGAPIFALAMQHWADWMAGHGLAPGDATFASWGAYDHNQLSQDAARAGVPLPLGGAPFNIKQAFADQLGIKKCGMAGALSLVGLPLAGTHHRGIDDARNIARLLPWALGRAGTGPRR
ncbi:MAG: exonuclease domain-containing protein [Alphaproteobacteria bacterium]|nr:exonuclease domain-containing protein [Alphaproteobacteria bacterium]